MYNFFRIISDKNNDKDYRENDLYEILNKFYGKEKYLSNDLIDDEIKGIIVDLLYNKLIEIKQKNKIAVGNNELIKEKFIKIETKLNMLDNIFKDNIKHKNKIFS